MIEYVAYAVGARLMIGIVIVAAAALGIGVIIGFVVGYFS